MTTNLTDTTYRTFADLLDYPTPQTHQQAKACLAQLQPYPEAAQALEARPTDKIQEIFEILLGLSRKTNDDGGTQDDIRHVMSSRFDKSHQLVTAAAAAHRLQNFFAGMLDGQIQVAAELLLRSPKGE